MGRTTIELTEKCKDALLDCRLEHESSYEDTLWRLMGEGTAEYVTPARAREIADEQITERVIMEAQE